MATFLNPAPASVRVQFESPRSNHLSASGLSAASFRLNGLWRGSIDFSPSREGRSKNPLLSLTLADLPNAGFLVDLLEESRIAREVNTNDPQVPVWVEGTGDVTAAGGIELATGHGAVAGDLISFRQNSLPDFVTARRIVYIETNADNDAIARLDTQLPEEIFVTAPSTKFEYCLNRPHVRARFVKSPQRWRKDNSVSMQVTRADWVEDTAAMVQAWRSISVISGVAANQLVTQQGIALLTQDGQTLVVE